MSEANAISSLLSHCKTCQAKCCKDGYIIHTKTEYQRIIDAGYDDHFKEIEIPQGSFYVLYFRHTSCPYLAQDKTCSIEEVKSDTCRAYPAQAVIDRSDQFLRVAYDKKCPAAQALCDTFQLQADDLVKQHVEDIPYPLHKEIISKYQKWLREEHVTKRPATLAKIPT